MGKIDWRLTRVHYSFALGILIVIVSDLKSAVAVLFGYALFALITALRFRTLGWKSSRAFIPLGMAAGGTLVAALIGPGPTALKIVTQSHAVALFAQVGMSIRAALSYAAGDPISRKMTLGRDLRVKRRHWVDAMKAAKPVREEFAREMTLLNSLNAERAAHVATHGCKPTPESTPWPRGSRRSWSWSSGLARSRAR